MDNPLLWIVTAVLVILCVVMIVVAGKSFHSREQRMKAFYEKANRQKALVEKYKDKPAQALAEEPAAEVIEGLAAAVQKKIEDAPLLNEAFLQLPQGQRAAYAAYYFFHDSEEKLSAFFRNNGEPLLSEAVGCLREAASGEAKELIEREYEMLDDNNESVSVNEEQLRRWDEAFAQIDRDQLREQVKRQILSLDGLPVSDA